MNPIGLIAVALSIWAFAEAYKRLRTKIVKVRLLIFFILALQWLLTERGPLARSPSLAG